MVLLVSSPVHLKHTGRYCSWNVQLQKISILSQRGVWNSLGGGVSLRADYLKWILSLIGIFRGEGRHGAGFSCRHFLKPQNVPYSIQCFCTSHNHLCSTNSNYALNSPPTPPWRKTRLSSSFACLTKITSFTVRKQIPVRSEMGNSTHWWGIISRSY